MLVVLDERKELGIPASLSAAASPLWKGNVVEHRLGIPCCSVCTGLRENVLSPLKGERDSLPGASGRNASTNFFGRKHQGHISKTQISSDWRAHRSLKVWLGWQPLRAPLWLPFRGYGLLTVPMLTVQEIICMSEQVLLLGVIPSFRVLAHVSSSTYALHCSSFSWVVCKWTVEFIRTQSGHLNVAEGEASTFLAALSPWLPNCMTFWRQVADTVEWWLPMVRGRDKEAEDRRFRTGNSCVWCCHDGLTSLCIRCMVHSSGQH